MIMIMVMSQQLMGRATSTPTAVPAILVSTASRSQEPAHAAAPHLQLIRVGFCLQKNQVRFNESNRINKHLKISCCNCGWLKSRKQVEPVLTVVWCNEIKHFPPRAQSCGRTPRARAPVPAHPNCNCKYFPWWCLNRFKPVDRFTMRTICRTFWTGSGRDCHAYSEPVHAPEPDQNRHNVKRRCVNRG